MNYLIIDATNLLYRTWHVTQQAPADILILTYLRSIRKYINEFKPDVCYSVSDKRLKRGVKNFRRQDADYKQNRDKSLWQYVHESEDTIEQLTAHLGIINMFPGILEADDVISFLCNELQGFKTIVSTDNDMAQLINTNIQLYSPVKKVTITHENFEQYFPVSRENYLLYKSIVGDKADNIKGLPGFGKVKAKRLTENFKQEECKLSAEQKNTIAYNMGMVNLSHGLEVHPDERDLYKQQFTENHSKINLDEFFKMCKELGLNSIVHDTDSWEYLLNS
jgi:DNA polymerase-1